MRATPVAAVPALLLVVAGQSGASLHVPSLGQHAVLGLDAVGRIFLGFTSVLWLTSGWYARAYLPTIRTRFASTSSSSWPWQATSA